MSSGAELPGFTDNTGKLHTIAETEGGGSTVRLTMEGRIETDNSLALTADLKELLELPVPPKRLIIHMAGVHYVSSTGIGAFVGLLVDCRKRAVALELEAVNQRVKSVFDLLGFANFFHFT